MIDPNRRARSLARRLRTSAGLALIALACSCADDCARGTAQSYVHRQAQAAVFHAPDATLWREVRALLEENGYALPDEPPPRGRTAIGPWRELDAYGTGTRVLVRFDGTPGRTRVSLRVQSRAGAGVPDAAPRVDEARDAADWLWQLLERTEPAQAAAITAEAQRRAEHTYAAARGCDRIWEGVGRKPPAASP